jgi:hypothetical protein
VGYSLLTHLLPSAIVKWRSNGLDIREALKAEILIDQPAMMDRLVRMKLIERDIEDWEQSDCCKSVTAAIEAGDWVTPSDQKQYERSESAKAQLLAIKARAESFFKSKNALLGRVFAASGYRFTPGPQRKHLDWALIEVVTSRLATNTVSSWQHPSP